MSGIVRVSTPTPLELAVKRVERAIRAAERGDAPPECIGLTATVDVFTLNLLLEAVDEAEHKAKDSEDLRYEIESLSGTKPVTFSTPVEPGSNQHSEVQN